MVLFKLHKNENDQFHQSTVQRQLSDVSVLFVLCSISLIHDLQCLVQRSFTSLNLFLGIFVAIVNGTFFLDFFLRQFTISKENVSNLCTLTLYLANLVNSHMLVSVFFCLCLSLPVCLSLSFSVSDALFQSVCISLLLSFDLFFQPLLAHFLPPFNFHKDINLCYTSPLWYVALNLPGSYP